MDEHKLTADLIDWTAVPYPYNFVTQDASGCVMMHTERPEAYAHNCTWNGSGTNRSSTSMSFPCNGMFDDWQETLCKTEHGYEAMDSDGGWNRYDYLPFTLNFRFGHPGNGSRQPMNDRVPDWQERIFERPRTAVGIVL